MPVEVTVPVAADLPELVDVAARTFPLACPPSVTPDNITAFIEENLTGERFTGYLSDPDRQLLIARDGGRIVGYAMLIRGVPADDDVQRAVTLRPAVEISKIYVLPDSHGAGVAVALMSEVMKHAERSDAACMWLGVNQRNERAQRFYAKQGFVITGTKSFRLGTHYENDYVMVRPV